MRGNERDTKLGQQTIMPSGQQSKRGRYGVLENGPNILLISFSLNHMHILRPRFYLWLDWNYK